MLVSVGAPGLLFLQFRVREYLFQFTLSLENEFGYSLATLYTPSFASLIGFSD